MRRMDAFRAAISALSVVVGVFEGGAGDDDGVGERDGDSGSFSGSWVVGSWKEGLRRCVEGDFDERFDGE